MNSTEQNILNAVREISEKNNLFLIEVLFRGTERNRVIEIFIDGDNLFYSSISLGLKIDYAKFQNLLNQTFGEGILYYYLTVNPDEQIQSKFLNHLQNIGYRVTSYPLSENGESMRHTCVTEMQLALDAVSYSQYFDKFVIVSGDKDFLPLISTLKKLQKKVIILSLPIVTSMDLRKEADQFFNLEELLSRLPPKAISEAGVNWDEISELYLKKGLYFGNYIKIRELCKTAKSSITFIDNYMDEQILHLVSTLNKAIKLRLITRKIIGEDFFTMVRKLKKEDRDIDVYKSKNFHDRFIRIDDVWWHSGHSIKDLGSGDAMIMKISNLSNIADLQEEEREIYRTKDPIINLEP